MIFSYREQLFRIMRAGLSLLLAVFLLIFTMTTASSVRRSFILGSGSASRKAILTQAGYGFEVIKPDIDESVIGDRSSASKAADLVLLLASAKADAIIPKIPDRLKGQVLLTADQVVVYSDQILEKPRTKEEARERIIGYGKAPCRTVGSIVLTDTNSGRRVSGVDTAVIHFSPIPDDIIQQLLDEGEVMHCAGGLMVEHPLVLPYRRLEGDEDSVMGLSLNLLESLLEQLTP